MERGRLSPRDILNMIDTTELATDDIGKQPAIYGVIALLIMCVTLTLVARSAPPGNSFILVDAVLSPDASVTYIFDQKQWRSSCNSTATDVEGKIREGCANCVTTAQCAEADSVQTFLAAARGGKQYHQTLFFSGGSATFSAGLAATAESACEAGLQAFSPADRPPPFCASTEFLDLPNGSEVQDSLITFSLGVLILGLTLAVVAMSYFQRRSMGELEKLTTGHRQATSIATFLTDIQALFLCWLSISLGAGSELTISPQTTFTNQILLGALIYIAWLHFGVDHYRSRLTLHAELSHTFKAATILGLAHHQALAPPSHGGQHRQR